MASETTGVAGIADRYAAALYDLADEHRSLDEVASDLRDLRAMIEESGDLRRLIRSPVVGREAQTKAMAAVLETAGMSDLTRRFVGVAAANRRLFVLPEMIKAYLDLLAARRGEVTAEVAVAAEPSRRQISAIEDALRRVVGGKVVVDLRVDPGLIGGMIVKVGSRMFDTSLRTKLQNLRLAMKGVG